MRKQPDLDPFEINERRKRLESRIPPLLRRYALPERLSPELRAWCDTQINNKSTEQPSILLHGTTGTGKTTAAYGMTRYFFEATYRVPMVETAADLCGKLRPGGSDESPEATLHRARRAPILMLDEMGEAKNSEWVSQEMYRVIDYRSIHLMPTIYTVNALDEIDQTWGERFASRIVGLSQLVEFTGPDLRFREP